MIRGWIALAWRKAGALEAREVIGAAEYFSVTERLPYGLSLRAYEAINNNVSLWERTVKEYKQ